MRVWLAWIWLLVFANAVAPKTFLHAFHAHEETCHDSESGHSISSQHEHCDFLRLQLFSYVETESFSVFTETVVAFNVVVAPQSVCGSELPSELHLRGPTVC